jgi:hypothetical protein
VFLAATLIAASLGVVAQDNHSTRESPSSATAAQSPPLANARSGEASARAREVQASATARESDDVEDSAGQQRSESANGQLPQTSTMLPLLGLIGLGSLVAGFFARR